MNEKEVTVTFDIWTIVDVLQGPHVKLVAKGFPDEEAATIFKNNLMSMLRIMAESMGDDLVSYKEIHNAPIPTDENNQ